MLKYTLAFIFHGDQVLMLRRNKAPNKHLLNGVGGKLEEDETPVQCIIREIGEEVGVRIDAVQFAGVVTWGGAAETGDAGMYVFFAPWPAGLSPAIVSGRGTEEGALDWYPVDDVCASHDRAVVDNIPFFLPQMLSIKDDDATPHRYHCRYDGRVLEGVEQMPLAGKVLDEATRTR